MQCPSCQVELENTRCPNCGYRYYGDNISDADVVAGDIIVATCPEKYCVRHVGEGVTIFCPHMDKMGHHKDPRKVLVFCNPIRIEGIQ